MMVKQTTSVRLEGDSLTVVRWITTKSIIDGYTQNSLADILHWISRLNEFQVFHQYLEDDMEADWISKRDNLEYTILNGTNVHLGPQRILLMDMRR